MGTAQGIDPVKLRDSEHFRVPCRASVGQPNHFAGLIMGYIMAAFGVLGILIAVVGFIGLGTVAFMR